MHEHKLTFYRAKVARTYQNYAFNFDKTRSWEIETIDSMIILLFPCSMRISNQSIIHQNYIENEDLVSTVDFRSFAFNQRYLEEGLLTNPLFGTEPEYVSEISNFVCLALPPRLVVQIEDISNIEDIRELLPLKLCPTIYFAKIHQKNWLDEGLG